MESPMKLVVFAVAMLAAAPVMADEVTVYRSPSGSTATYFYRDPSPSAFAPPAPRGPSASEIQDSVERALLMDRLTAPRPPVTGPTLQDRIDAMTDKWDRDLEAKEAEIERNREQALRSLETNPNIVERNTEPAQPDNEILNGSDGFGQASEALMRAIQATEPTAAPPAAN